MSKCCNGCSLTKPLSEFPPKSDCRFGVAGTCRECKNTQQRYRRKSNKNKDTKSYEKTKKGYLMRTYRNMKSRVTGVLKKKNHLYLGLPIMDKDTFYIWSLGSDSFNTLFEAYEASGWDLKLAPSIDRRDPEDGYVEGNVQWLTHSENSKKIRRINGKSNIT